MGGNLWECKGGEEAPPFKDLRWEKKKLWILKGDEELTVEWTSHGSQENPSLLPPPWLQ